MSYKIPRFEARDTKAEQQRREALRERAEETAAQRFPTREVQVNVSHTEGPVLEVVGDRNYRLEAW